MILALWFQIWSEKSFLSHQWRRGQWTSWQVTTWIQEATRPIIDPFKVNHSVVLTAIDALFDLVVFQSWVNMNIILGLEKHK